MKTANGIRVTSTDPANSFSLELAGASIEPLSANQLLWRIDGLEVELLVAQAPGILSRDEPPLNVLRAFRAAANPLGESGPAFDGLVFPTGEPALVWRERSSAGGADLIMATMNAGRILLLCAYGVTDAREKTALEFLQRTLLSLKRTQVKRASEVKEADSQTGATMEGTLRLMESLTGDRFAVLVDESLLTARDRMVQETVPLDRESFRHATRLILAAFLPGSVIHVWVFDRQTAHSIVVQRYDAAADRFQYFDPWPAGSFLERNNNRAGVAAVEDPSEKRKWWIDGKSLDSVLYGIFMPRDDVYAVFRLATALVGTPENAMQAFRALKQLRPESQEISNTRFQAIEQFLLVRKQLKEAATIFRIRRTLWPKPDTDEADFMRAFTSAGGTLAPAELLRGFPPETLPRPLSGDLSALGKSDLMTYFNFKQTDRNAGEAGRTVVRFRPAAGDFKAFVELSFVVGREEVIEKATLALDRKFIDNPATRPFANDVAKSFVATLIPGATESAAGTLIEELRRWRSRRVPVPGATEPHPGVPAMPSLAMLTYLGVVDRASLSLSGGVLHVANSRDRNAASLAITVETAPAR